MKATEAFDRVTGGRRLSGRTYEWISDLVDRFGDEAVAATLDVEAPAGPFDKLLYRVRDRLAKAAIAREAAPTELTGRQVLAIARGELAEPERPYVYDTRDLSREEYAELVAGRISGPPNPVPSPADPQPDADEAAPWLR